MRRYPEHGDNVGTHLLANTRCNYTEENINLRRGNHKFYLRIFNLFISFKDGASPRNVVFKRIDAAVRRRRLYFNLFNRTILFYKLCPAERDWGWSIMLGGEILATGRSRSFHRIIRARQPVQSARQTAWSEVGWQQGSERSYHRHNFQVKTGTHPDLGTGDFCCVDTATSVYHVRQKFNDISLRVAHIFGVFFS
jgi:hypothetical protein